MPDTIRFQIRRQDRPDSEPYWQEFEIPYKPNHNVVSALMVIRENPVTVDGKRVEPVVWESNCMEEVCGACAMVINGRPRQACSALIDQLEQPIVLEPLSKFPVVRDLMIDRTVIFRNLRKVKAWNPLDGSQDVHVGGPRISQKQWKDNYVLSRCMSCGNCMEACPQFGQAFDFIGPAILAQVYLKNNNPLGAYLKEDRLHAIMGEGGLSDCGNAQNCVKVCPKELPLTEAIAKLGRQVTVQLVKDLFGRS